MCMQNLNIAALAVPEIIGVPEKIGQSLDTSMLPFVRMDALSIPAKCEIRSFSRSSDNKGYPKNLGSPWIRPRFLFSKIFHGLLFGWSL